MRVPFTVASMANSLVDLGFVEPAVEPWRLRSPQFPSKAGGRPAWLSEAGMPGGEELACRGCGRPCAFLLQLYAPTREPHCFHRSLYLFCCRQPACHRPEMPPPFHVTTMTCYVQLASLNVINKTYLPPAVFRNHLPRKNETYSYDPPPNAPPAEAESCSILSLKSGGHLCRVCGCLAPKTCSKCHMAHYCSKDHQVVDWKLEHKKQCGVQPVLSDSAITDHGFLFPEYEIVTEPEEPGSEGDSDKEADDVDIEKDVEAVTAGIGTMLETQDEKDLEAFAKHETKEDQIFEHFKKKIATDPKQVLRYCRDGNPLWISGEHVPQETDIPNCSCGAKRIFEFQVMPQLLSHLNVDSLGESIDWGTLAVFTCAKNCNQEKQYAEEFLWKQAISMESL